jgi:hypothetical protein
MGCVAKINLRRESSSIAFRSDSDPVERGDNLRLPLPITSGQSSVWVRRAKQNGYQHVFYVPASDLMRSPVYFRGMAFIHDLHIYTISLTVPTRAELWGGNPSGSSTSSSSKNQ